MDDGPLISRASAWYLFLLMSGGTVFVSVVTWLIMAVIGMPQLGRNILVIPYAAWMAYGDDRRYEQRGLPYPWDKRYRRGTEEESLSGSR